MLVGLDAGLEAAFVPGREAGLPLAEAASGAGSLSSDFAGVAGCRGAPLRAFPPLAAGFAGFLGVALGLVPLAGAAVEAGALAGAGVAPEDGVEPGWLSGALSGMEVGSQAR